MKNSILRLWLAGTTIVLLAACGGEKKEEAAPAEASPASNADIKPAKDGKVIEVELYSNETGNFFKPNEITANAGDVIKFELKSGVHNVNFFADSNPGRSGLPKASDMLQLPDQEYRVYVGWAPGKYYFQCDPHALLGMKGHVTVK